MGGTISDLFRRRATRLILSLALLAGVIPVGIASAANSHEATWTDITFTSTTVEVIDEGESWVDEDGNFHLHGNILVDEISGDINGSALITLNIDFEPAQECGPDDDVCPGYFTLWGSVEITDENGRWEGDFMEVSSDVPDDEFEFSSLILRGLGGNSGKSIVAEFAEEAGDDESVLFEGQMMTMATPKSGLNLSVQLCFGEMGPAGGFHGTGAVETSGNATGEFFDAGSAHTYGLWGTTTLTDDNGSVTIVFGGNAVDVDADHSNGWGHFVIVDGTGEYAGLFGHGRTIATAGVMAQCTTSGAGVFVNYIGEAHYN